MKRHFSNKRMLLYLWAVVALSLQPAAESAKPPPRSVFLGWEGHPDCEDGVVTMTEDIECIAVFGTKGKGRKPK